MKTWLKFFFAVGLSSLMVILISSGDGPIFFQGKVIFAFGLAMLLAFFFEKITKKW
jgi:uncharacterized membrane protein